tara:strand:- start:2644 stop:3093 length:450 start_codon:yes stop_codon:yes gene_type:complete
MQGEHNFYIKIIYDYIKLNFPEKNFYFSSDLDIHDSVERVAIPNPQKPPPELIKVPDLVAEEQDNHHFTILGEAKTFRDFINDPQRVNSQLDYYFNRLKYKNNGILIYSLPHTLKNKVTNLIIKKKENWNTQKVKHLVITDLDHARTII